MNPKVKLKPRAKLALLFSILLILACGPMQISGDSYGPSCTALLFASWNTFIDHTQYMCSFTCPDGTTMYAMRNTEGHDDDGRTYEQLKADTLSTCKAPKPTATPTQLPVLPASEASTSTPTATATPLALLSGEVSACNMLDRYINFTLAANAAEPASHTVEVTWNEKPIQCEVPASNTSVLSCVLPRGIIFPAQINISIDGRLSSSFSYDGGGCVIDTPTRVDPPEDSQPEGEPICTGVPPYPEGCTPP